MYGNTIAPAFWMTIAWPQNDNCPGLQAGENQMQLQPGFSPKIAPMKKT
jgi:hypothetical protein